MKWLLFFLFVPSLCQGQVYKFRCFDYRIFFNDPRSEKWDSTNILVVLNQTKLKINVYGKSEQDIDLIKRDTVYSDKDGVIHLNYQGINEEGERCKVSIYAKDIGFNSATGLIIDFANYTVAMRLRDD